MNVGEDCTLVSLEAALAAKSRVSTITLAVDVQGKDQSYEKCK